MTETLKQKIDAHFGEYPDYEDKVFINKAIQELREEIKKNFKIETGAKDWKFGYNQAIEDVLALIGEKNNV